MDKVELSVSVILIDDGSIDNTPKLMEELSLKDSRFSSVFLSRNFGHQIALTAGFSVANASEAVFVIDGDLQDPPELLEEFYPYLKQGYEVVYAIRKKRKESWLKKLAYNSFYKILKKISYIDIPLDSGDFSLISRKVVDNFVEMKEESRFIRGMRTWLGYKQIGIEYERQERHAGDSKYPFSKLLKLAFNGIFNFSEFPVKFISTLGVLTILVSLMYLFYALIKLFATDVVPEGFVGIIFIVTLFGGIQLLSIGILGEYILRIFFQVKNRPLFIIKKQIHNGQTIL
jgi:dolichol-phosphate mannosyltransferase